MSSKAYYKSEGITVRSFPFGDHDRIITIFTQNYGLASLLVKGRQQQQLPYQPFSQCDWVYQKTRGELFRSYETCIVHSNLALRKQSAHLQLASDLCSSLVKALLPGKATPELYQLFACFLQAIPKHDKPSNLLPSFLLKFLRYEGLITFDGESLIQKDQKRHPFTTEEERVMHSLCSTRSLEHLGTIEIEVKCVERIKKLFEENIA